MGLGLMLILAGILFSDLPKMIATLGWPTTDGMITFHRFQGKRFEEYDGDFYDEFYVIIRYEYTVDGISYTSRKISAHDLPFYLPEASEQYPIGKEVIVYYDPSNPADAVLEPGFVDVFKAFDVFSWLFFGAGIYFIVVARNTKMNKTGDFRLG